MKTVLALLFFGLVSINASKLKIEVIAHRPCHPNTPSVITFSDSRVAPVESDPSYGEGCYKMGGQAVITRDIKGTINVYCESKNGTRGDPLECKNYDSNGCGGIGSCIYCDACGSLRSVSKKNNVDMLIGGKPLDCATGLKAGTYDNVKLHFCTPELDDFLKTENIERHTWDTVVGPAGQTVYMTMHIYEKAVTKAQVLADPSNGEIGCHKLIINVLKN